MKKLLIVICFVTTKVIAQDFDKVWVNGAGVSYTTTFTAQGPVNALLDTFYSPSFVDGHSNICDSSGSLSLASTGHKIVNSVCDLIDNGDSVVPALLYDRDMGSSLYSQSSIFLPVSGKKYYVVTPTASDTLVNPGWSQGKAYFDFLLYSIVDMNANNGMGKVVKKMVPLLQGVRLSKTQMMACKHGDGKSWWLLKQALDTNLIYKFLFTQDSVYGPYLQGFMQPKFKSQENLGQSVFTKNGTKYATTRWLEGKIFLADFDRCSGVLSNPVVYNVPNLWTTHNPFTSDTDKNIAGLAFSPNGKYLYVAKDFNILQLDLTDPNPATAWYHVRGLDTSWSAFMLYSAMYLGPDDKLYIGNWHGLSDAMSVIDNPNNKGSACNFCARCLKFPPYYYNGNKITGVTSPPCMPNYKLGATNPPCWVTGINDEAKKEMEFSVYPNPNNGQFTIQYHLAEATTGKVQIIDLQGTLIKEVQLHPMLSFLQLDLGNVASGAYFYRFLINDVQKASGKIIVIK